MLPRSLWIDLAVVFGVTLVLTFAALVLGLDLSIAKGVFERGTMLGAVGYDLSLISYGVAVVLLVAMSFARVRRRFPLFVRCSAVFIMTMIIAVLGFVQNTKKELNRPRPREVRELGGKHEFTVPFGSEASCGGKCTSFPSSAAASAFLLSTPFFVLRRKHRALALAFLVAGLGWGSFVGYARLIPGSHWFSDIVWSATFVFAVASALSHVAVRWREPDS